MVRLQSPGGRKLLHLHLHEFKDRVHRPVFLMGSENTKATFIAFAGASCCAFHLKSSSVAEAQIGTAHCLGEIAVS
jgi:hypothetical protein